MAQQDACAGEVDSQQLSLLEVLVNHKRTDFFPHWVAGLEVGDDILHVV
jgi:hypothetical protein